MGSAPVAAGMGPPAATVATKRFSGEGDATLSILATLDNRGRLADRLAREIPTALQAPSLTLERAERLYEALRQHGREIECLIDAVVAIGIAPDLLKAADALVSVFNEIADAVAEKVAELSCQEPWMERKRRAA